MTDQELKDLVASLAVSQSVTDEQLKRTGEKLDKIGLMLGSIANNQGSVSEAYFINSLKDKLQIADITFDVLIPNYKIIGKDVRDELDILLVNGESIAIVEVKYKVHLNDIKKLAKKIINIKKHPQYRSTKVYAGIAGFSVNDDVFEYAKEHGYFILERKGDIVETYASTLRAA